MKKTTSWMVCAVVLMTAMMVRAELLTFTMNNVGSDVVASVSGSVNTAGLNLHGSGFWNGAIQPDLGILIVDQPTSHTVGYWKGLTVSDTSFGTGGTSVASDSFTGNYLAGIDLAQDYVILPWGYVSGTVVSSTATWNDTTLSALGVTEGTYTATYNGGADSIVVNVVPEPSIFSLLGIVTAVGFLIRRRFIM
jgi:hypothetical protein